MRMMAAAAALALSGTAFADTTSHYTVLFQGRVAGSEIATVRGDGGVDVQTSYRHNGRGPDLEEHSRFAPDGRLAAAEVEGTCNHGAADDGSETPQEGGARQRCRDCRGRAAA